MEWRNVATLWYLWSRELKNAITAYPELPAGPFKLT
jgi:hypothetical protein